MNAIASSPFTTKPAHGELHVWIARHDQLSIESSAILSPDEIERANRFVVEHARNAFVSTRTFLRIVLGNYLSIDPHEVAFLYDANGKPSVAPRHLIYFNVSHTVDLAAIAFSTMGPVGIDVEKLAPVKDADEIAQRYFSSTDAGKVQNETAHKSEKFLQLWVRKEAELKCSGLGLSALTPESNFVGYVEEFQPAPDHLGAIAVFEAQATVRLFDWSEV